MSVLKPQQNAAFISLSTQSAVKVAKFGHGEMPKSTNNPRANIRV
jgi:hypothetical protein